MAKKITVHQYKSNVSSHFVCPECLTVHEHVSCSLSQGNCMCLNNQFPNHPVKRFRQGKHYTLDQSDIILSDTLLLKFCQKVESLYGSHVITPNMHMHCHLVEIVKSYGSIHGFWLFSYERYNGILGNQPHNNKNIECQLMKRFFCDNYISSLSPPESFNSELLPLFTKLNAREVGSCYQTFQSDLNDEGKYSFPNTYTFDVLTDKHVSYLSTIYAKLHPQSMISSPNSIYKKYLSINLHGKQFLASAKTSTLFVALAHWDETIFGPFPTPLYNQLERNSSFRPVKIHHFGSVSFSVGDEVSNLPIAVCSWYLPHQQFGRIGKPVQIWCADKFEHPSYYCFVPIHLIKQHCSYSKICINDEWLLQLIPLIE